MHLYMVIKFSCLQGLYIGGERQIKQNEIQLEVVETVMKWSMCSSTKGNQNKILTKTHR